jgi:flagellar biosynthetic protein FliR
VTATLLAVFARAVGFFARAPGFSRANVPPSARVVFALALTIAVLPSAGRLHEHAITTISLIVVNEALTGAVLGFGATLVFEAFAAAGRMLDDLVGLRASVPGIAVAPVGFGGLWLLVFIAAFFALGGVDALIVAFVRTFSAIPLGGLIGDPALRSVEFAYLPTLARVCLQLAAPAICVTLCVHAGLGVVTRVIPRFGHLSLAFPAAYAAAMLTAFVTLAAVRDLAAAR